MTEPARGALLPTTGLVLGICSVLPPYVGPALNVARRVEIADHVVPGVVVILVSTWMLLRARRGTAGGVAMLVAGLAVLLAGVWMIATHAPLILQAMRDEAPVGSVVYHSLPGVVVALLGAAWSGSHWTEVGG